MPKFRPSISQELRSAIPFAKHAAPVEVYSRDGIVASIMTGERKYVNNYQIGFLSEELA